MAKESSTGASKALLGGSNQRILSSFE